MMQKGQLSIDFMLSLVVVLVFIQFLLVFSDQALQAQTYVSIKNQEYFIARDLESALLARKHLPDLAGATVAYKIPKIYALNRQPAGCTIKVDGETKKIEVSVAANPDLGIEEEVKTSLDTAIDEGYVGICGTNIGVEKTIKLGQNTAADIVFMEMPDTMICGGAGLENNNYGAYNGLQTDGSWTCRVPIKTKNLKSTMDVAIGANKAIISAKLKLYATKVNAQTLTAYRLLRDWEEGTKNGQASAAGESSWNEYSNPNDWGTPGAEADSDREKTAQASAVLNAGASVWYEWDITNAFKKWYSGEWQEQGIILIQTAGTDWPNFVPGEGLTGTERPYIEVKYAAGCEFNCNESVLLEGS